MTKHGSKPIPRKWDPNEGFIYYCQNHSDGSKKSYVDVARKHNLSVRNVEMWGKRNKWVKRRLEFGKKQVEAFFNQREKIVRQMDKQQFDEMSLLEKSIMSEVGTLLKIQKEASSKSTFYIRNKAIIKKRLRNQSSHLKNLTKSLVVVHNQKRLILGIPTGIKKADVENHSSKQTLSPERIKEMDDFIRRNHSCSRNSMS